MRLLIFFLFAAIAFVSCKDEDKKEDVNKTAEAPKIDPTDSTKFTTILWLDSLVDFGTMKKGETKTIEFRFRNTGDKPLVVSSVVPGCGCTVPEFTREAVQPGKEGYVKAVFNSSGQPPTVHKTITVATNTKKQFDTISFIGEIN
jgi:hypothetical protein